MEDWNKYYTAFFERISRDPRIRISHLAVFCGIFYLCIQKKGWIRKFTISVYSNEVMANVKLNSRAYHRTIIELAAYGYLKYKPSKSKHYPSEITIIVPETG